MTFGGIRGFTARPSTPFTDTDGNFAGIVHQERNVTYANFYEAGHMVPRDKPKAVSQTTISISTICTTPECYNEPCLTFTLVGLCIPPRIHTRNQHDRSTTHNRQHDDDRGRRPYRIPQGNPNRILRRNRITDHTGHLYMGTGTLG